MNSLVQCLAVGMAGFAGAVARMLVGRLCGSWFNTSFPVGTVVINLSGSLLLGWFYTVATRAGVSDTMRLAIAVGFLGAYTTFSTWMYESNEQLARGQVIAAGVNLLGSVVLGIIAIRLGIWLGTK